VEGSGIGLPYKYHPNICLVKLRKTMRNFCLYPGPSEYETGAFCTNH